MSLSALLDAACRAASKATVWLLFFGSLLGCAHEPAELVAPQIPMPKERFVVVRDYPTTWNALLRALDGMKGEHVKSLHKAAGTLVLAPVTVPMAGYCDCGSLGRDPLRGRVRRQSVIKVKASAPRETFLDISCTYETVYHWKDRHGRVLRRETIPCISNGAFEKALYGRVTRYLSP